MRLMYLHAYQSYIWNSMVSKRLQVFGDKPVLGDLARKIRDTKADAKEDVIIVTEDNLSEFEMEHIVLPLPGHNVIYPNNESMQIFFRKI